MLTRQRTVLSMLVEAGGELGKLDLYKLLFLLREEARPPREAVHDFVPYRRGPYSFTLAYDLKSLEAGGMVTQTNDSVRTTGAGADEATQTPAMLAGGVEATVKRHRGKDTWALIDHVYKTYPWFTLNSEWEDRRAVDRPVAETAIYTVGYEGLQVDGLLNRLLQCGIRVLIDVRFNPVARRYGFHKSTLAALGPRVGIDYLHVPQFGIPGEWRGELGSSESYRALFSRYEHQLLADRGEELVKLAELLSRRPSALMCKEADPSCCHRTTLARRLAGQTGLPIFDLGEEVQPALL